MLCSVPGSDFPTPAASGACGSNLPRHFLPAVPSDRFSVCRSPFSHRRCVKQIAVRPPPNPRTKQRRKKARPPPQRAEELRRVLAESMPYKCLPVEPPPDRHPSSSSSPASPDAAAARTSSAAVDASAFAFEGRPRMRATPSPRHGFSKMFGSVDDILRKIGGQDLEAGWSRVGEYIDAYQQDDLQEGTTAHCMRLHRQAEAQGAEAAEGDLEPGLQGVVYAVRILEQALLLLMRAAPRMKPALRYAYGQVAAALFDGEVDEPVFAATHPEGGGGGGGAGGGADGLEEEADVARFKDATLFRDDVRRVTQATQEVRADAVRKVQNLKLFCEKLVKVQNMSFLKVVFREWKLGVRRAKVFEGWFDDARSDDNISTTFITEGRAKEQQLAETAEQLARCQAAEAALREDAASLRAQAAECQQEATHLESIVHSQQVEISALTHNVADLTALLRGYKRMYQEADRAAQGLDECSSTLATSLQRAAEAVSGDDAELVEKDARWGKLDVKAQCNARNLMMWVLDVSRPLAVGGGGGEREPPSWEAGPHLLLPLGGVLHMLAPTQSGLDAERYQRYAAATSFQKRAEMFVGALASAGVTLDVSPSDLAQPSSALRCSPCVYHAVATLLYFRFAGGVGSRVCGAPPFTVSDDARAQARDARRRLQVAAANTESVEPTLPEDALDPTSPYSAQGGGRRSGLLQGLEEAAMTTTGEDEDGGGGEGGGGGGDGGRSRASQMLDGRKRSTAAARQAYEEAAEGGYEWLRSGVEGLQDCIRNLVRNVVRREQEDDATAAGAQEWTLTLDELPFVESEAGLHDVNNLLSTHSEELGKIFTYYASLVSGSGGTLKVMEEAEYMKFVLDAKLFGRSLTRTDLLDLLARVSPTKELTLRQWLVLLPRVARLKFKSSERPISVKLKQLLSNHVLVHSKQLEADAFKKTIYSDKVQAVLKDFSSVLLWVFKLYATRGKGEAHVLQKAGYDRLLHDMHIADHTCTQYILDEVFHRIQDPDDDSEDLIYHEFCECLVAIAAVKRPEPYLPLSQRFRHFLDTWVAPLKKMRERKKASRAS